MRHRTWEGVAVALVLGAATSSCDDGADTRSYNQAKSQVIVSGVGATTSRALFAKWADQYALVDPSTSVRYDAAGSGAGVRAALDGTSDFGVSDDALSDDDAAEHRDVLHLPVAVEAIAIVYSLAGLPRATHLQMSEDVLADALLGRISWWDDAAIASLNVGIKLPHTMIRPAYRADQSGSSQLLSDWLKKTTHNWSIAPTRSLTLPGGAAAVQKDDGMVARLRGSDGALGYLSAARAYSEQLPTLAVRNAAGHFVQPSLEGMREAAAAANLGADLRAQAVAAPGDLAYPICSFTFLLVRADGPVQASRHALARFLWWATHDGQSFGPSLGFGALPGELLVRDEGVIRALRAAGQPAL